MELVSKMLIEAYDKEDPEALRALAKRAPLHEVLLNSVVEHLQIQ